RRERVRTPARGGGVGAAGGGREDAPESPRALARAPVHRRRVRELLAAGDRPARGAAAPCRQATGGGRAGARRSRPARARAGGPRGGTPVARTSTGAADAGALPERPPERCTRRLPRRPPPARRRARARAVAGAPSAGAVDPQARRRA